MIEGVGPSGTPPPVGSPVWFVRRKWPDGQHYEMLGRVLGEDDCGTWLGATPPVPMVGKDGILVEHDAANVWCVPRDDWFLLHAPLPPAGVSLYVDICTPARWEADRVVVIDLDLDVEVWRDGRVPPAIVDQDELEEHRIALGYPDELTARAIASADDVLAKVLASEPPFSLDVTERWHEVRRQLDP